MKTTFKLLLVLLLLPVRHCAAEQTIGIYGTEKGTRLPVLAIASLPDSTFENSTVEQDTLPKISYKVVARDVDLPTQGNDGSIIYWKGSRLWRYKEGKYYLLLDAHMTPRTEAFEASNAQGLPSWIASTLPSTDRYKTIELWKWIGQGDTRYSPEGPDLETPHDRNSKAIGWADDNRLIIQEEAFDEIDRLKSSDLVLSSFVKTKNEQGEEVTAAQRTRLLNLPQTFLVLIAAVNKDKVAFQIYDTTTASFRIGIKLLTDKSNVIKWLPNATDRGHIVDLKGIRLIGLSWNPSGTHLAVSGSVTMIWDDQKSQWHTGKLKNGKDFTKYNGNSFLWVDNDRMLLMGADKLMLAGRITNPDKWTNIVGNVEGMNVNRMFRLKGASSQNSDTVEVQTKAEKKQSVKPKNSAGPKNTAQWKAN